MKAISFVAAASVVLSTTVLYLPVQSASALSGAPAILESAKIVKNGKSLGLELEVSLPSTCSYITGSDPSKLSVDGERITVYQDSPKDRACPALVSKRTFTIEALVVPNYIVDGATGSAIRVNQSYEPNSEELTRIVSGQVSSVKPDGSSFLELTVELPTPCDSVTSVTTTPVTDGTSWPRISVKSKNTTGMVCVQKTDRRKVSVQLDGYSPKIIDAKTGKTLRLKGTSLNVPLEYAEAKKPEAGTKGPVLLKSTVPSSCWRLKAAVGSVFLNGKNVTQVSLKATPSTRFSCVNKPVSAQKKVYIQRTGELLDTTSGKVVKIEQAYPAPTEARQKKPLG